MTGFVMAFAPCLLCRLSFPFNPRKVPSFRIEGVREPICGTCMDLMNATRVQAGLSPFPIEPDAYESLPEEEL